MNRVSEPDCEAKSEARKERAMNVNVNNVANLQDLFRYFLNQFSISELLLSN